MGEIKQSMIGILASSYDRPMRDHGRSVTGEKKRSKIGRVACVHTRAFQE